MTALKTEGNKMAIPITKNLQSIEPTEIDNLLLKFTKYNGFWNNEWENKSEGKSKQFDELVSSPTKSVEMIQAFNKQMESVTENLQNSGYHVETFKLTTKSKMMTGLGGQNVMENSLQLHHLFGFPIIPGSTLKGITREYAVLSGNKNIKSIFGSETKVEKETFKGEVMFLDASPSGEPNLAIDILTPHYTEYYQDGKLYPGDWYTPVPISFLAVDKNSEFNFTLYSKNKNLCVEAAEMLFNALCVLGVGAKTSIGYGLFNKKSIKKIVKIDKNSLDPYFEKNGSRTYKKNDIVEAVVEKVIQNQKTVRILDKRFYDVAKVVSTKDEVKEGDIIKVKITNAATAAIIYEGKL